MRDTPKTTAAQIQPPNHPHTPSPNTLGAASIYAGTVLKGTVVKHGKIHFDFTGDETFIGTFSPRAIPTSRA